MKHSFTEVIVTERTEHYNTKKIKLGKGHLTVSGLFGNEGWRFSGGLSFSYFDALFEYALTCGESGRKAVMSRKFS